MKINDVLIELSNSGPILNFFWILCFFHLVFQILGEPPGFLSINDSLICMLCSGRFILVESVPLYPVNYHWASSEAPQCLHNSCLGDKMMLISSEV